MGTVQEALTQLSKMAGGQPSLAPWQLTRLDSEQKKIVYQLMKKAGMTPKKLVNKTGVQTLPPPNTPTTEAKFTYSMLQGFDTGSKSDWTKIVSMAQTEHTKKLTPLSKTPVSTQAADKEKEAQAATEKKQQSTPFRISMANLAGLVMQSTAPNSITENLLKGLLPTGESSKEALSSWLKPGTASAVHNMGDPRLTAALKGEASVYAEGGKTIANLLKNAAAANSQYITTSPTSGLLTAALTGIKETIRYYDKVPGSLSGNPLTKAYGKAKNTEVSPGSATGTATPGITVKKLGTAGTTTTSGTKTGTTTRPS